MLESLKYDRLLLTILLFTFGLTVITGILFMQYGSGEVLVEITWYMPMMQSIAAFVSICVSFLAFGRIIIYRDSHLFWIGVGFLSFSILSLFYILTWPDMMSGTGNIFVSLPSTSAWFAVLELGVLGSCLFAAATNSWPPRTFDAYELFWTIVLTVLASILASALVIRFEELLPPLISARGTYLPLYGLINVSYVVLFLSGALLSLWKYFENGHRLLGYVAFAQVTIAFVIIARLIGFERYDLWHYLSQMFLVGGFGLMFGGILAEYIELLRLEFKHNEALRQADQDKNDFLAVLSHELRNPLATITSSLELLRQEQEGDTKTKALIYNAEEHLAMMRRLLEDLLDTVRLTRGQFTLQKEPTLLSEVIRQSVASVDDFVKQNKHTLIVDAPTDESIALQADPVRLKQILINLLTNACKYTEPGGTIELIVEQREDEIGLHVRDTGVGIQMEEVPHIFKPYRQVSSSTKRGTGLGIGLYITRQLVEMHGGRIKVRNRTDRRGTIFSVYLPSDGSVFVPKEVKQKDIACRGDTHVLIVDDNETAADLLAELLSRYGCKTAASYSGAAALNYIATKNPDVVLLDIGMPGMDGYEVARRARGAGYLRKIIALTGYGLVEDREKTREAGFDHHLVKPAGAADILKLIT